MTQEKPDPAVECEFNEKLRKAYENVLKEELPERFKELLEKLYVEKTLEHDITQGDP